MKWLTTIQLIKLNAKLPKNERNNGNNNWLIKDIIIFIIQLCFNPKKKTMATIYSTLDPSTKIEVLTKSIQFAKKEIADNNLPPNTIIQELAIEYVWQIGITLVDYANFDIISIPAWTGPLPIKFPRP